MDTVILMLNLGEYNELQKEDMLRFLINFKKSGEPSKVS